MAWTPAEQVAVWTMIVMQVGGFVVFGSVLIWKWFLRTPYERIRARLKPPPAPARDWVGTEFELNGHRYVRTVGGIERIKPKEPA